MFRSSVRRMKAYLRLGRTATIDVIANGALHGWAWDRGSNEPVRLALRVDGRQVHSGAVADRHRADLKAAGHPTGNSGFAFDLVGTAAAEGSLFEVVDTRDGRVLARAHAGEIPSGDFGESGEFLPDEKTLACRRGAGVDASQVEDRFIGRLERVEVGVLHGWALNESRPSSVISLEILVNGHTYRAETNAHFRGDVDRKHGSGGVGGLRVPFRLPIVKDADEVEVTIRFPDGTLSAPLVLKNRAPEGTPSPLALAAPGAPRPVSVIVPVYNALDDLRVCIAQVLKHLEPWANLVVVEDASPDRKVRAYLEEVADHPKVRVFYNERNRGFTASCNRGITAAEGRDIVLLNSDARVQRGWLRSLQACAYSSDDIGTATPLSDRAGAFSVPEPGNDNDLPADVSEAEYARAFRRRSLGLYPIVPTGNGFCMYIKRACLDTTGPLDEAAFPRGYGEENDLCCRASRLGWLHAIDDRTLVFHANARSFGSDKSRLVAEGRSVIDARYPEYKKSLGVFQSSPLLSAIRLQARLALVDVAGQDGDRPSILFVTSTQTGGTPQTNLDLMRALESTMDCWLLSCDTRTLNLSRLSEGDLHEVRRARLEVEVDPLSHRSRDYERIAIAWMEEFGFDILHIRHLGWHSLRLPELAKRAGMPVVLSVHDYYCLCPTTKLIDGGGSFCGGDCTGRQGECKAELWPDGAFPPLRDAWVNVWRNKMAGMLAHVDQLVTTSGSVVERFARVFGADVAERFEVVPHGRDFEMMGVLATPPVGPLRVLVPGNIGVPKGAAIIEAIAQADEGATIEFHVLGKTILSEQPGIVMHGTYQRDDFFDHVARIRPQVGAILSIWDETWCHTLTEMWSAGVPVAALRFPTVAGRIVETGGGWLIDGTDPETVAGFLREECTDRASWLAKVEGVIGWQADQQHRSVAEMAEQYRRIYDNAIRRAWHSAGAADTTQAPPGVANKQRRPGRRSERKTRSMD